MQQQYQGYPNYLHQTSQFDYYSPRMSGFGSYNGVVYNPYGGMKDDLMALPKNWWDGAKAGSFDSWIGVAGVAAMLAPMYIKKGMLKKKKPKKILQLGGLAMLGWSLFKSYQPIA